MQIKAYSAQRQGKKYHLSSRICAHALNIYMQTFDKLKSHLRTNHIISIFFLLCRTSNAILFIIHTRAFRAKNEQVTSSKYFFYNSELFKSSI